MGKYSPLGAYLEDQPSEKPVRLTVDFIADLVGGLPASSSLRQWWENSRSHSQAKAWMDAGRLVLEVENGRSILFSAQLDFESAKPKKTKIRSSNPVKGSAPLIDGVLSLQEVLLRAGYASTMAAVAAHTIFLHPLTVKQSLGKALFPIVRDQNQRGVLDVERGLLYDDNSSPTRIFEWAANLKKGRDVQFNHIWTERNNRDIYTALWNICVTPAFLAKTTDGRHHPEVINALKYRSYELYGFYPKGDSIPIAPDAYENLQWPPSPPPLDNLESAFRARLSAAGKSRPAIAARTLGWLFSDGVPDETV